MKKYRVTEKHPSFKEGGILIKSTNSKYEDHYRLEHNEAISYVVCDEFILDALLRFDFVQEIIDPEFTKDDMIEFGNFVTNKIIKEPMCFPINDLFNNWKNEKR